MRKCIAFILLICCAGCILLFSMQNAEKSDITSGNVSRIIARMITRGFDELSAREQQRRIAEINPYVRKMAHFCEFALFGALAVLCFFKAEHRKRPLIIALCAGALLAVCDETLQTGVPGRSGSPVDMLIDTAGVTAGTMLIWMALNRSCKKRSTSCKEND